MVPSSLTASIPPFGSVLMPRRNKKSHEYLPFRKGRPSWLYCPYAFCALRGCPRFSSNGCSLCSEERRTCQVFFFPLLQEIIVRLSSLFFVKPLTMIYHEEALLPDWLQNRFSACSKQGMHNRRCWKWRTRDSMTASPHSAQSKLERILAFLGSGSRAGPTVNSSSKGAVKI